MTTIFARTCIIITTRDRLLRVKGKSHLRSSATAHRNETKKLKETSVVTFHDFFAGRVPARQARKLLHAVAFLGSGVYLQMKETS